MAADEQPDLAYLVLLDQGGIFGAYTDEEAARKRAQAIEGVVLAAPIIADYRPKDREAS